MTPKTEPIVRVEDRRLRRKLDEVIKSLQYLRSLFTYPVLLEPSATTSISPNLYRFLTTCSRLSA